MTPLRTDDTLSKYTIRAVLGSGSTATVYRAHDPFRDREVAIKVFDPRAFQESGDELTRNGFFSEAALLGKLNHPHVVQVFDAATGPDDYFIVSEYVPGGTLDDYVAQGRLMDIEAAIDVAFKCVDALRYLHAHGVIHRDIKPENIFLGDGTNVKLGDFGAASVEGLTQSQALSMGSPAYMSPQRLEGAPADVQSDIFSLGVLFYQLVTGQRPFTANSIAALAYQMQSIEPTPPSELRAGLPKAVDQVVARALAADLQQRYQDWGQFYEDLMAAFREDDGRIRASALESASGRFQTLRQLEFFAAFTANELWELVGIAAFHRVVAGDAVMRENDIGREFFLIIEGAVRIVKGGKTIDVVQSGATLGELAYVLEGAVPRNATAYAMDDGLTLRIANDSMASLSPLCRGKLEKKFLRILALRLIDVNRRLSHA